MSARDKIISRVRASLAGGPSDAERRSAALARIGERPRHPTPGRVAGKDAATLKTVFRSYLETQGATVVEVASGDQIPQALAAYLRDKNLPQRVRMGDDPRLGGIDWTKAPSLEVASGKADPGDETGVSHATAAVAETGTLVLASGPDNPVTLSFLPETHVVVVRREDIVGPYEDAFQMVRDAFGTGVMPRTVNMISGPSRTGDIGGRIVMGAHGPRRMCVIIVDDE